MSHFLFTRKLQNLIFISNLLQEIQKQMERIRNSWMKQHKTHTTNWRNFMIFQEILFYALCFLFNFYSKNSTDENEAGLSLVNTEKILNVKICWRCGEVRMLSFLFGLFGVWVASHCARGSWLLGVWATASKTLHVFFDRPVCWKINWRERESVVVGLVWERPHNT
jgi:hypothetical protein